MRITAVRTVVVWGPRRPAYGGASRTALGPAAVSEHAIVFVDTDAGITGIGEISSVFKRRGRLLARDVEAALAPAVVGEDPRRIAALVQKMDRALDGVEEAKAGIEMALWDILGKALDTPGLQASRRAGARAHPAQLLGAVRRARARWPSTRGTASREGHRTIKVKVGNDPARDVEAVQRVREAIGPACGCASTPTWPGRPRRRRSASSARWSGGISSWSSSRCRRGSSTPWRRCAGRSACR